MKKPVLVLSALLTTHFMFCQNVGIGTNTPLSKLHVAGTIRSDTLIGTGVRSLFTTPDGRIYDSLVLPVTVNWQIAGNSNITANHFLGTINAADVVFKTSSIERARILATGNFGIGTATPGNKLEINAGTANSSGLRFTNLTSASPTVAANGRALSVDASGNVVLMSSAANAWQLTGNAGTTAGTNFLGTTDGQDLVFRANNIEHARLGTSGLFHNMQSAFVNTIGSDGQGINVNPVGGGSLSWRLNNHGYAATFYNQSALAYAGGLSVKILATSGNNNILDVSTGAQSAVGIPVLVAKGNGLVGIGTSTPLARLHVNGDILAIDNAFNQFALNGQSAAQVLTDNLRPWTDNGMRIYDGDTNSHLHVEAVGPTVLQSYGVPGSPPGTLENTAFSDLFLQNRGGNVGIGVLPTVPANKLEIQSVTEPAIFATRNFTGLTNAASGFIGGTDNGFTATGIFFVQKDNVSLGNFGTNLINIASNGAPQVVVNGTGNMRIGGQFYNAQNGGVVTAPDQLNVKLAVMGGFSSLGNFNDDPAIRPAPERSWVGGVGSLVLGMNRMPGTSNVDFWNVTDPGNGFAAIGPTHRGFNWRNFNLVGGVSVENSLMWLNGLGNLTITGALTQLSDQRLKTNVRAFENNILEKVMQLNPKTYEKHSSGYDATGNIIVHSNDTPINDFGFIAQEVYAVFPELVSKPKDESKELWSVDYSRLSVMLTKAMQEQQKVIDSQEVRIRQLEKALTELLEKK